MSHDGYLKHAEEVMFRGSGNVSYDAKRYQFVLTNKRIVLLGPLDSRRDEIVTVKLSRLHDVRYNESGLSRERGDLQIETEDLRMDLYGPAEETKEAYEHVRQLV